MKEFITGFLAESLNLPVESVSELLFKKADDGKTLTDELNTDAKDKISAALSEHIAKVKGSVDTKKIADDQYKRGKVEALDTLERAIREKFGVQSEKRGVELIDEIVATVAKSDLEDDKIKRSPLYLQLETRLSNDIQALTTKYEAEKADIEKGFKRKETLTEVRQKALGRLEVLQPVPYGTPEVFQTIKGAFAREFEAYDYEPGENGSFIAVKDGKRLENKFGHAITFDELVDSIVPRYFVLPQQGAKGNAGNATQTNGSTYAGSVPKSIEDFSAAYNALPPGEQRTKLVQAYEAANRPQE